MASSHVSLDGFDDVLSLTSLYQSKYLYVSSSMYSYPCPFSSMPDTYMAFVFVSTNPWSDGVWNVRYLRYPVGSNGSESSSTKVYKLICIEIDTRFFHFRSSKMCIYRIAWCDSNGCVKSFSPSVLAHDTNQESEHTIFVLRNRCMCRSMRYEVLTSSRAEIMLMSRL